MLPLRSLPAAALLAALAVARPLAAQAADTLAPPPVQREFRGVWIASVGNIDWPSRPGLSTAEQQRELVALLDRAAELRLNAVVFQVRPAGDALYASKLEPWSEYLTGRMGQAPEPFYDPLAFAVEEAHARGLELHAWFNPFRARYESIVSDASPTHITRARPALVRRYGRSWWMDPGEAAVQEHSLRVVLDVVKRYDIDGVHIDDYFYPYRVKASRGGYLPFPDDASWRRYRRQGGRLARDDWRRRNVDRFVERLYGAVKKEKPWVKFGISPFGIWRPGFPAPVRGLDAYTELYADSRKWLREGWVDYFAPQLYWRVGQPAQSYPLLLDWWVQQNVHGRHLWPGNYTSRSAGLATPNWPASELLEQIRLTRAQPGSTGNIHFSMTALMPRPLATPGPLPAAGAPAAGSGALVTASPATAESPLPVMLGEQLRLDPYGALALVPASPWLSKTLPAAPVATARFDPDSGLVLALRPGDPRPIRLWVIRARIGGEWTTAIVPAAERGYTLGTGNAALVPDVVLVTAIDRYGNESARTVVRPPRESGEVGTE